MQFNNIIFKNFMSYESGQFFFYGNGLVLIEGQNKDDGGSNGSGKSTVWDAISWCLFGSTVRGLKNDEVVNRKLMKDCMVELSISIGPATFRIRRYRKHGEYGNRLLIEKQDEKIVELGTLDLTQKWLNDLIDFDFDLFRCTVIFAQGETFNFVNAGNKKQKEILSKVMKIDFDKLQKGAKERKKDIEIKLEARRRDLMVMESHIKDVENLYAKEIEAWSSGREGELQNLSLALDSIEFDLKRIVVKHPSKFTDVTEKLMVKKKSISESISALSKEKMRLLVGMEVDEKELNKLDKAIANGVCDFCGQDTKSKKLKDRRHDLANKMMAPILELETLEEKMGKLEFSYEEIEEKIKSVAKLERENNEKNNKAKMLKAELLSLGERIEHLINESNPYLGLIEEEKEKQREIEAKIKKFESERVELEDQLIYINFWVEGFGDGGIKSFVFDLIANTLSEKSNKYVNILTNGQISIKFDTQSQLKSGETREKFDCSVISDGKSVKYDSYSGGEKRRISLAVDMALAEVASEYHGSKFNIVVFDEQTNYLDKNGRESFFNLLKELGKERKVFVVDHDSEFKSKFDEVITISKRKGISFVDEKVTYY